jgi:2-phosphoglycerate kinase
MTRFHHQRLPLIILVCGTACVGKSTIATQLAQRLNLPNILQVSHSPAISSAKSNSYI